MNMKESTPKEQILASIRNALIDKAVNPYTNVDTQVTVIKPVNAEESPDIVFADMLIENGGEFMYCENESAMADILVQLMNNRGWSALCAEMIIWHVFLKLLRFHSSCSLMPPTDSL